MPFLQGFLRSGRQDLNLRPPGALPDCATPRGAFRFYGESAREASQPADPVDSPTQILAGGRARTAGRTAPTKPCRKATAKVMWSK